MKMTSRERVLCVLNGGIPDRVPWIENFISNEVVESLTGHTRFVHATYGHKIENPGMIRIPPIIREILPIDNISYDFSPPRFAQTQQLNGHDHVMGGKIKS